MHITTECISVALSNYSYVVNGSCDLKRTNEGFLVVGNAATAWLVSAAEGDRRSVRRLAGGSIDRRKAGDG